MAPPPRLGDTYPRTRPAFAPWAWITTDSGDPCAPLQRILEEVQPGLLGPHIAPLQTRLKSLLGSQENAPEEIARRIRILQAAKRSSDLKWFELIASTLLKRRRLLIRHWSRARDEETEREVSPQRLVHYRDAWYLDAWCHRRDALRSFGLDVIQHAAMLDAPAVELADETLDTYFAAAYGIFGGPAGQRAVLRFSAQAARWVADEQWHPQQQQRSLADGRLELVIPYAVRRTDAAGKVEVFEVQRIEVLRLADGHWRIVSGQGTRVQH